MSAIHTPCRREDFAAALEKELSRTAGQRGIGTLGEKTLHSVLKNYLEPDSACHEIKVGGFVADIVNDSGITEIQTRAFEKLLKKLPAFLELTPVTVVYPVVRKKWLVWINPESGETTSKRLSPKTGKLTSALAELPKIREFIKNDSLTVKIIYLDVEEYRLLNGWSSDKKNGSTRFERLPVEIIDEITFHGADDLRMLLPDSLPDEFTAAEFDRAVGMRGKNAFFAKTFFEDFGIITRNGSRGRAYLYQKQF